MISLILVTFLVLGIGGYLYYSANAPKQAIAVLGYYDDNKNLIEGDTQSVVNNVEGVKYVTFQVNARNKDTVPLKFTMQDATPTPFYDSLDLTTEINAESNNYATWVSELVDIEVYEGTTQEFCVTIIGTSPLRNSVPKTSCVSLVVEDNPTANFDVEIVDSVNGDPDYEPQENTTQQETGNVIFRTTNLDYDSVDNGVALASSCGANLVAYGKTSGACTDYNCNTDTEDLTIPSDSGTSKLFIRDSTDICICYGGVYPRRYNTGDADALNVDTSITSLEPSLELAC